MLRRYEILVACIEVPVSIHINCKPNPQDSKLINGESSIAKSAIIAMSMLNK